MRWNKKLIGGLVFLGVPFVWWAYYQLLSHHFDEPIIIDNPKATLELSQDDDHEKDVKDKDQAGYIWRRAVHNKFTGIKITVDRIEGTPERLANSRVVIDFDDTTGTPVHLGTVTFDWSFFNLDINPYGSIDVNANVVNWDRYQKVKLKSKANNVSIARVTYTNTFGTVTKCYSTTCGGTRPTQSIRVELTSK